MKKLLAIDIGNTNTVIGIFEGETLSEKFRLTTNTLETSDEVSIKIAALLRENAIEKDDIENVIVCSVVPQITGHYVALAKKSFGLKATIVGPGVKTGTPILYDNPKEVGADRIANTVGGYNIYGGPLIIVDLGTAITFDYVSEKGEYVGGVIAPGIATSMAFLSKKAAQLPQVALTMPKNVIGKNTVESMQSGAVFGFSGLIDSIVEKIKLETKTDIKVVATGGDCEWLKELSSSIDEYEPNLTLYGLLKIQSLQK